MITEEFLNRVLDYEGLLAADVKEYSTEANGIHRGWKELDRAFKDISGWEAVQLEDGFPMLKPKGADTETCSYIHVDTNQNHVPRYIANIVVEIDEVYGEPFYSVYTCTFAPDLLPLLIAFGV